MVGSVDVMIQNKSPPTIFSLASLGFGGNLRQLFFVNNPSSILLNLDKYNNFIQHKRPIVSPLILLPGSMFDSSLGRWLVFPQCTSQTLPCQFQKH